MGTPIGLDFGAVMTMAAALQCDAALAAELLPVAERAILKRMNEEGGDQNG